MAISSVLSPDKIVGRQNTNVAAAQNFISGGAPIGSSVVGSAANKIVGFERAAVKPVTPDINNIISTITNNVLNQVDNSIRSATNITNNSTDRKIQQLKTEVYNQINTVQKNSPVTQLQTVVQNIQTESRTTVQKTVDGVVKNYKEKVSQVDAAKPTSILEKFLSTYKKALGFIQFFANRKNIQSLNENLDVLKKSFTDSFEVSKLIREVIFKIVRQLSNLPKASPGGGGGLNLDIDLPSPGLKKSAPRGLGNMFKGAGGKLALGGLAVGGTAAAVNALSDSDRLQSFGSALGMPGEALASLTSFVERFSEAIDVLFGIGKNSEKSGGSSGGGGGGSSGGGGGGGGGPSPNPGGNVNAGDIIADTPEEKAFIATVREREGTAGQDGYSKFFGGTTYGGDLTNKTVTEVVQLQKKFLAEGKGNFSGGRSAAVGAGQFMEPENIVRAMGMDPDKVKFTPELQNQMILYLAKKKRGVDVSKPLTLEGVRTLNEEWSGFGPRYGQNKNKLEDTLKIYEQNLKEAKTSTAQPAPGQGGPDLPDFMLSPQKREELKLSATTVSQPPPSQQQGQSVNMVPINMGQTQSSKPQQATVIPGGTNSGETAPNIPSYNPNNFLVLYSKMVYNIVDG